MVKQTPAQAIGRAGERWFQALLPGEWLFQAPAEDIGLDGKVTLGTPERTGQLEFGVQVKSSKHWDAKDGIVSVAGIKRETVQYWGSRLYPTMLVLYDAGEYSGYWGWLYDILLSPIALLESPHETITLKVPTTSRLTATSWPRVQRHVEVFYEKFVHSLSQARLQVNLLPTIHSLAMAVDILLMAQFEKPESQDDEHILVLGEVAAHREVMAALHRLVDRFGVEGGSPHPLAHFIALYRTILSKCYYDVDLLVAEKTVAIRADPSAVRLHRPKLIRMVCDLIVRLSGDLRSNSVASG